MCAHISIAQTAKTTPSATSTKTPNSILVDFKEYRLTYYDANGVGVEYSIGAPKPEFRWSGTVYINHIREWPTWTPPAEMILRKPHLAKWRHGMPGGPQNPLGAAALYLFQDGVDTLYRIHGTNEPDSIGTDASSGCIRMRNEDVTELAHRIRVEGKKVTVTVLSF